MSNYEKMRAEAEKAVREGRITKDEAYLDMGKRRIREDIPQQKFERKKGK
jgi:hypothetical protein